MAEEQSSAERTLEPSQRKLEKAREEGRFPQSRDLSFLLLLAVAGLFGWLAGAQLWRATAGLVVGALQFGRQADPLQHLVQWSSGPLLHFCGWLLLLLGLCWLAASLGPMTLSGLRPVFSLRLDLSKLDPVAGLARMVSKRNLFALAKGVLVTLAVLALGALFFLAQRDSLMLAPSASLVGALSRLGSMLGSVLMLLLAVVTLVAAIDASFQWRSFRGEMRMAHQEMKDEMKESEGSPETRARIRTLQREGSRRRMMAAVATADVVVVNPTHYAVALRYDPAGMAAPTVVAKGEDQLALRLREQAKAHAVPVAESPALARWIHARVALDQAVPVSLYPIVAQLLAWAYDARANPLPRPLPAEIDAELQGLA